MLGKWFEIFYIWDTSVYPLDSNPTAQKHQQIEEGKQQSSSKSFPKLPGL